MAGGLCECGTAVHAWYGVCVKGAKRGWDPTLTAHSPPPPPPLPQNFCRKARPPRSSGWLDPLRKRLASAIPIPEGMTAAAAFDMSILD